jgi:hypothetical protein
MPALVASRFPGPACVALTRITIRGGHAQACCTAVIYLHTAVHSMLVISQLSRTIHDDMHNPARETLARRAAPRILGSALRTACQHAATTCGNAAAAGIMRGWGG